MKKQKGLYGFILIVLAFLGVGIVMSKTKNNNTGGSLRDSLNDSIVSNNASKDLSRERKKQLGDLADKIYASMKGAGTYYNDWVTKMSEINTDNEYIYMVQAFGKKEGKNFDEYYSSEYMLGAIEFSKVNKNYKSKGMDTRI